jgi:hypothetical protein
VWSDQVRQVAVSPHQLSPTGLAFLVGSGKLLLVLGSTVTLGFRTHDHVFVLSTIFTNFEIGLIIDKRKDLTAISDSPTTGLSEPESLYG